jgi:protein-S-isoprenylcysteine O-methyltransferase Ste14
MNKTENPNQEQTKKVNHLSPWLAYPLALIVWWVLPWAISLLTPHYGWAADHPGLWNLLGLIPVLIGTIGLLWGVAVHSAQSPEGIEWELDKSYLLQRGLYAYSRHPMYLSELILLFGWIIFYGSVALVIAFVIAYLLFNYYAMPQEERILEAHFGEAYRQYKRKVPRWLGKIRR